MALLRSIYDGFVTTEYNIKNHTEALETLLICVIFRFSVDEEKTFIYNVS